MSEASRELLSETLMTAGIDGNTEWFYPLVTAISTDLETGEDLESPEQTPMITVDLTREHLDWIVRNVAVQWEGRDPQSLWVGESELFVRETLWSKRFAYVVLQDVKGGFICWVWQSDRAGVLRIASPHLSVPAGVLESESIRVLELLQSRANS